MGPAVPGVQRARHAGTQARAGPAAGCGRDAVRLPHRLPVALPTRVVRALDEGVVAVPPLVTQRHLGASADSAARGSTGGRWSRRGDAVDAGHRHPPGARSVQRWVHLPRPRRPLRPHQGRQAHRGGRRDRPPVRCAVPAGTTSSRYSVQSGTPGASRSPTGASAGPDDSRSRSRTPPPPRLAGSRSPASPPPWATCHALARIGVASPPQHRSARERPGLVTYVVPRAAGSGLLCTAHVGALTARRGRTRCRMDPPTDRCDGPARRQAALDVACTQRPGRPGAARGRHAHSSTRQGFRHAGCVRRPQGGIRSRRLLIAPRGCASPRAALTPERGHAL